MTTAATTHLEQTVRLIATTCVENETYFSDLDAVAGDGDFGYSLARGFENVLEGFDGYDRSDPGTFLQQVAMTMSSRIGGTSGPIWGTAFLRAAGVVKGREDLGADDVVAMLRAAVEGIKKRGGADLGDKTLLDAIVPMTDAIEADAAAGADGTAIARHAAEVARQAADATSALEARRGRASYTGERSIGSPDPGAVAVAVLAERVADDW
ncbi:dihydroxyacetone kinase subunit DhaL [Curtobacterium sp. RHCKG23]|jgi:dihydroxyacetone kinase-like protein|uniref:Dihydroxyacetone kinase subunit DhaL n=1 Tax=Curtobacterium citri TaxID=3055139 RepID=A0ABT7T9H3_9MICO|nr:MULTISPECIES: dihydroxyacetone kinase subunit DhaL [Curtobacterium]MBP1302876.1 dihydroxyacetone kinase-like protein [Curtobacterium sp. 1310]MDM7886226.1 dihydroxyacetone kinase subunit DhaL [Curtobacterium citri]